MVFLYFCFLLQVTGVLPYLEQPVEQSTDERIFVEEQNLQKTEIIENDSFFNLGIIKSNRFFEDTVFLLDYRPHPVVKMLSLNSKEIKETFGNGRGRGPGELINPTDFGVTKNGKVWIADEPQSKLSIFNRDGELYDDWVIEFTPYKIADIDDEMAVYSSYDPVIKLVDTSKTVIWTSKNIVENPQKWASSITGFLLSDDRNTYKVSNYTGELLALDHTGKTKYFRKVVEPDSDLQFEPIPGLDHEAYSIKRSELNFAIADGFIHENVIHLLVQFYGENSYQVIDTYNAKNGDYINSYKLDEAVRSITSLPDGTIIGLKPDQLIVWMSKN